MSVFPVHNLSMFHDHLVLMLKQASKGEVTLTNFTWRPHLLHIDVTVRWLGINTDVIIDVRNIGIQDDPVLAGCYAAGFVMGKVFKP